MPLGCTDCTAGIEANIGVEAAGGCPAGSGGDKEAGFSYWVTLVSGFQ